MTYGHRLLLVSFCSLVSSAFPTTGSPPEEFGFDVRAAIHRVKALTPEERKEELKAAYDFHEKITSLAAQVTEHFEASKTKNTGVLGAECVSQTGASFLKIPEDLRAKNVFLLKQIEALKGQNATVEWLKELEKWNDDLARKISDLEKNPVSALSCENLLNGELSDEQRTALGLGNFRSLSDFFCHLMSKGGYAGERTRTPLEKFVLVPQPRRIDRSSSYSDNQEEGSIGFGETLSYESSGASSVLLQAGTEEFPKSLPLPQAVQESLEVTRATLQELTEPPSMQGDSIFTSAQKLFGLLDELRQLIGSESEFSGENCLPDSAPFSWIVGTLGVFQKELADLLLSPDDITQAPPLLELLRQQKEVTHEIASLVGPTPGSSLQEVLQDLKLLFNELTKRLGKKSVSDTEEELDEEGSDGFVEVHRPPEDTTQVPPLPRLLREQEGTIRRLADRTGLPPDASLHDILNAWNFQVKDFAELLRGKTPPDEEQELEEMTTFTELTNTLKGLLANNFLEEPLEKDDLTVVSALAGVRNSQEAYKIQIESLKEDLNKAGSTNQKLRKELEALKKQLGKSASPLLQHTTSSAPPASLEKAPSMQPQKPLYRIFERKKSE